MKIEGKEEIILEKIFFHFDYSTIMVSLSVVIHAKTQNTLMGFNYLAPYKKKVKSTMFPTTSVWILFCNGSRRTTQCLPILKEK